MSGEKLFYIIYDDLVLTLVLLPQWRFCDYRRHAWVVRVGTLDSASTRGRVENTFENLHHFATYCQSIDIDFAMERNYVNIRVVDKTEGSIGVSVDMRS